MFFFLGFVAWCGDVLMLFLYVLGVLGLGVLRLERWESVFGDVGLLVRDVCVGG
jgi:hypothetical protein